MKLMPIPPQSQGPRAKRAAHGHLPTPKPPSALSRLNADVWDHILGYLGPSDLARAAQASRDWKATVDSSHHWEGHVKRAAPGLENTAMTSAEAKKLMAARFTAMRCMTAGQVTRVPFPKTDESNVMAAVDARGYVAASGGSSGIVRAWDLRSSLVPREVATLTGGDEVHAIKVSPDGARVAILYKNAKGTVWNPGTQQRVDFELPLQSRIKAWLIDSRLEKIVTQGRDRKVYLCRVDKTSHTIQQLPNDDGLLNDRVAEWNGRYLLFKDAGGFVRMDLATIEPVLRYFNFGKEKLSRRFDISADGRLAALRAPDEGERVFIWDLENEKCLRRIFDRRLMLRQSIFFSHPDRVMTASASCGEPRLYDLSGVNKRKTFGNGGDEAQILYVAPSPTQTHAAGIATGYGHESELMLWELDGRRLSRTRHRVRADWSNACEFNGLGTHLTCDPGHRRAMVFRLSY